ncbi:hypothetical protein AB4Z10_15655 [Bosea sp. RAF48]|uniref:DUF6894 family protein n=1 Tax=Bosea sp. RAF48 TaxID=3237480 RepID=UPI003F8EC532
MPKFRFTTEDGNRVDRDEKPLDFPDEKAAKEDAQRALADMAKDKLPDGNRFDLRARVENEAGQEVYRASLKFKKESD